MPLNPGTRVGVYEVIALLGEGGMGQVYLARDTKLDRDVALKILPDAFAADPDRVARFEREAKTLAAISHLNIAAIYGVEERALVMELVDGEDLSLLITRGIEISDALPIARQIADALEAAHENGIIHRDLKPANVKVRADGMVKVLDFGLAKAVAGHDGTASAGDLANSPTLTAQATQLGMILGTAAYMAPEQAKGKAVDKRADVWAFGVVLYEMLAGRPLFQGDSIIETMGFVATKDPDWSALPASTPAGVRRLLARCLTRDPRHRLRDIGEARIALTQTDSALEDGARGSFAPRGPILVAAVALIAVALATGWMLGSRRGTATTTGAAFHSEIVPTPADAFGRHITGRIFTFTPDGRTLIYTSTDPAARRLYRRDRDSDIAVAIEGTEGAYGPFMSSDGQSIGFVADGRMKRVPVAGGTAQVIRDFRVLSASDRVGVNWSTDLGGSQEVAYGAAWLGDDTVVYGRFSGGLWRVGADGGTPTELTQLSGEGELAHRLPHALPGGRAILCTVVRDLINLTGSTVEAVDLGTGARTKLVDDASDGRYVAGGYLLFARRGGLYSLRFDPARLTTSGEPVKIADNVMHMVSGSSPARASGVAQYDVSADGVLALITGGMIPSPVRELVWVSADGNIDPLPVQAGGILGPRLSPEGSRITTRIAPDVFVVGVKDGVATPVARNGMFPIWHPDGARIFAALRQQTRQDIHSVSLTSGGATELIASSPHTLWTGSVSRDGKFLFYVELNPRTGHDIWQVGLSPRSEPVAVLATAANESYPMISPDSKWLAYVGGDGTSTEIYVRAFPGPGPIERVSRDGGIAPVWQDDGRAIYYGRPQAGTSVFRDIVRVPIDTTGPRISLGALTVFATGPFNFSTPVSGFDVTKDGKRILASRNQEPAAGSARPNPAGTTIRLIVNPNLAGRRERQP